MSNKSESKKKRGRPKKDSNMLNLTEPQQKEKRGRGRPKKSETEKNYKQETKRKLGKKTTEVKDKLDKGESLAASFKNKDILSLMKKNENDSAFTAFRRNSLKMLVKLIATAEKQYITYPTDRNVYALSNLMSQAREIIAELQADTDKALVVHKITTEIINPQQQHFGNALIESNTLIKKKLQAMVSKKEHRTLNNMLDQMTKDIGKAYSECTGYIAKGIEIILNET